MSEIKSFTENEILLKEHLELFIPAFNKMKVASELKPFLSKANDCLSNTPFMYLLTGHGVVVFSREAAVKMAEHMYNKPMGDYSG